MSNESYKRGEAKTSLSDMLNAYKLEDFDRKELGNLNFDEELDMIKEYLNFFNQLSKIDLNKLPLHKINQIITLCSDTKSVFDQMKRISLEDQEPSNIRKKIITSLHGAFSNGLEQLGGIVEYFRPKDNQLAEQALKNAQDKLEEIKRAAETASSQTGVAVYADLFKTEAEEHNKSSKLWLNWLKGMILIIIGWGVVAFFINPANNDTSKIFQYTIAKIIITSGLFYALSLITKNYKAHVHNHIVNRHKHNSLKTFETFVKGAGDDVQTKNAVLLSATQSIFTAQPTGYSNQEADNDSVKIIEMLKTTPTGK